MIRHISVSGSSYECGLQIGQQLKEKIQQRLHSHIPDALFDRLAPQFRQTLAVCETHCPRFMEELKGIAAGAEVEFERIFLLNCEELCEAAVGCTTIAEVTSECVRISHNEDTGKNFEEHVLISYTLPDCSFTAFAYAGSLPGDAFAWNTAGVCFTTNYLAPIYQEVDPTRIPRNMVARQLIESQSIAEAVTTLQKSPDASGYHYFIGSQGRIVSVEQCLDQVSVIEVVGQVAHANHYIHSPFAAQIEPDTNSGTRQGRADALLGQHTQVLDILADTQTAPDTICRRESDNGRTLSTVQFDLKRGEVLVRAPLTGEVEHTFSLQGVNGQAA